MHPPGDTTGYFRWRHGILHVLKGERIGKGQEDSNLGLIATHLYVTTHYAEIIHFIAVALVYKSQDFLFDRKRKSPHGLSAWGSNPDTHISGVMLYQLHELPSP